MVFGFVDHIYKGQIVRKKEKVDVIRVGHASTGNLISSSQREGG